MDKAIQVIKMDNVRKRKEAAREHSVTPVQEYNSEIVKQSPKQKVTSIQGKGLFEKEVISPQWLYFYVKCEPQLTVKMDDPKTFVCIQ